MHSSDIQFMIDRPATGRVYRATIPLDLCSYCSYQIYESLNEQNWMCELCTFSQIQSHLYQYFLHISLHGPVATFNIECANTSHMQNCCECIVIATGDTIQ